MITATHTLVVYDDGDDGRSYFIEHSDDCPYDHDDSFVIGGKFYRCNEGLLWVEAGEYAVTDIEKLPTGRYAIWAEFSHTPSTPNGPAEWDAWLEVGNPRAVERSVLAAPTDDAHSAESAEMRGGGQR